MRTKTPLVRFLALTSLALLLLLPASWAGQRGIQSSQQPLSATESQQKAAKQLNRLPALKRQIALDSQQSQTQESQTKEPSAQEAQTKEQPTPQAQTQPKEQPKQQPKLAQRPYIGFVYPAGGRQGTTFAVRLGGQDINKVTGFLVSGKGINVRLVEYRRWLNNMEVKVLIEELQYLNGHGDDSKLMSDNDAIKEYLRIIRKRYADIGASYPPAQTTNPSPTDSFATKLEKRIADHVPRPACKAISSIIFAEVSIDPDAAPGERQIRVVTPSGASNPLAFYVGQVAEYSRKPLPTSPIQVLGKEEQALRKRPKNEAEDRIKLPCTVNGQISSGEVNRYRFSAHKGERLVITTLGRQLIPFIADAVPGWLQPVVTISDSNGKEVACDDHYKFKPDPVVYYEVPRDGEYVLAIHDALYRGREDFVYRITIGELPFVTSIFPLGGRVGAPPEVKLKGWNVEGATLGIPPQNAVPGIYQLAAGTRNGIVTNRVPFAMDTLPECYSNHDQAHRPNSGQKQAPAQGQAAQQTGQSDAQKVNLPIIINGRISHPNDSHVFQFTGKANETIVAEVYARRLDSPLDSVLSLTDSKGKLLAFNDDHEDPGSGLNTHDADSYIMAKLPADGTYFVRIGDTSHNGGDDYAYRLRISEPQPDFSLRITPSSAGMRSRGNTTFSVYAVRQDGFNAPISLSIKEPDSGFFAAPVRLTGNDDKVNLTLHTRMTSTDAPVDLRVEGRASVDGREIVHTAVPAEDRMQAFLWRHLVPAGDLKVAVFDPRTLFDRRKALQFAMSQGELPFAPRNKNTTGSSESEQGGKSSDGSPSNDAGKPKSSKQTSMRWFMGLTRLHEEGLLSDDYYNQRVHQLESGPPPGPQAKKADR